MKKRYKYKDAIAVAKEIESWLKPYCERITIAGSLRRKKPEVGDIEILCIPKEYVLSDPDKTNPFYDAVDRRIDILIAFSKLNYRLNKKGNRTYGKQNKLLVHCASGIPVDIFSTTEENWWVALVVRTGPKESNIRICTEAKKWAAKFNVYGSGFTLSDGKKFICRSEEEVFRIVGLPCFPPEER